MRCTDVLSATTRRLARYQEERHYRDSKQEKAGGEAVGTVWWRVGFLGHFRGTIFRNQRQHL